MYFMDKKIIRKKLWNLWFVDELIEMLKTSHYHKFESNPEVLATIKILEYMRDVDLPNKGTIHSQKWEKLIYGLYNS